MCGVCIVVCTATDDPSVRVKHMVHLLLDHTKNRVVGFVAMSPRRSLLAVDTQYVTVNCTIYYPSISLHIGGSYEYN